MAYSVYRASVSVLTRANVPGTGSSSVTVHGASLGLGSYTGGMRVGQTSCEGTTWGSDTCVRCQTGQGVLGSRRVSLSVGQRVGSVTMAHSVYRASMSVLTRANVAWTGSWSVTVHGASLGLGSYTGGVRVGQTVCERTTWGSDTCVRCQTGQGVLGSRRVRAWVSVLGALQ